MTETQQLLASLKRELRARRITYRDVAKALRLSEPSVKRLFSTGRFTLERLAQVTNLLDLSLAELMQSAPGPDAQLRKLTVAQETELISDPKLLLVAVCALNHWTVAEILAKYLLSEPECIQRLLRLDRLRLIDLLPSNRVRLNVARDFDWLPDGPIRRFFRERGQNDFLNGRFDGVGEMQAFVHGMLTRTAAEELQAQLRRLRNHFDELHRESLKQPLKERHGTGLMLAVREWELGSFTEMRRSQGR
jgi:transcriptional regulator with XRE-family HTH domain